MGKTCGERCAWRAMRVQGVHGKGMQGCFLGEGGRSTSLSSLRGGTVHGQTITITNRGVDSTVPPGVCRTTAHNGLVLTLW